VIPCDGTCGDATTESFADAAADNLRKGQHR
jgi:hypothetical protein